MAFDIPGEGKCDERAFYTGSCFDALCGTVYNNKFKPLRVASGLRTAVESGSLVGGWASPQQSHLALGKGDLDAVGLKRLPDCETQGRFQVALALFGVVDPHRELQVD